MDSLAVQQVDQNLLKGHDIAAIPSAMPTLRGYKDALSPNYAARNQDVVQPNFQGYRLKKKKKILGSVGALYSQP